MRAGGTLNPFPMLPDSAGMMAELVASRTEYTKRTNLL
ncbi:hypothetical protein [Devosia sp. DBB001]|nr:hypothetical protein [Devosia sp. DBB001]